MHWQEGNNTNYDNLFIRFVNEEYWHTGVWGMSSWFDPVSLNWYKQLIVHLELPFQGSAWSCLCWIAWPSFSSHTVVTADGTIPSESKQMNLIYKVALSHSNSVFTRNLHYASNLCGLNTVYLVNLDVAELSYIWWTETVKPIATHKKILSQEQLLETWFLSHKDSCFQLWTDKKMLFND